jgi:hypothetical protein
MQPTSAAVPVFVGLRSHTVHPTVKLAVLPIASSAWTSGPPVRSYMVLASANESPIKTTTTPTAR